MQYEAYSLMLKTCCLKML